MIIVKCEKERKLLRTNYSTRKGLENSQSIHVAENNQFMEKLSFHKISVCVIHRPDQLL